MRRTRLSAAVSSVALVAITAAAGCTTTPSGFNETIVRADSRTALSRLVDDNPAASAIASQAHSVLVFPEVVKGGLVIGGSYGEGARLRDGEAVAYYTAYSGSWGLQAGAQSYGYALFLMNEEAVDYLDRSDGWEVGVGPTIVVVDAGVAENLSTSTLREDAYAIIFDQRGLMAGVSIEGTKITRVEE
ncbi:MAG: lipid-binding SYLF domain-containing protein [Pseudomonadota bacterium]